MRVSFKRSRLQNFGDEKGKSMKEKAKISRLSKKLVTDVPNESRYRGLRTYETNRRIPGTGEKRGSV